MTVGNESSFGLDERALQQMAATPPRRTMAKGQADIGGRLRVAQILRSAGITGAGTPERIAGSTNEVWAAGPYVIRISFEKNSFRLRREAAVSELLTPNVRYPGVIASGKADFGEWLVLERMAGVVLSGQWAQLERHERHAAVKDLAGVVRALHQTPITEQQRSALWPETTVQAAHEFNVDKLYAILERVRDLPYIDGRMIDAATERLDQVKGAFDDEQFVLVHGDLHLENVLADGARISALLDLEWTRRAPQEVDIDTLARFCMSPELHVSGGYAVSAADFRDVIRWFAEGYPEIFEHPRLRDRLTFSALAYEIPALLEFPPTAYGQELPNWHPVNRLAELLAFGSAAVVLGW